MPPEFTGEVNYNVTIVLREVVIDIGNKGGVGIFAAIITKLGEKSDQPRTFCALYLKFIEAPLVI